MGLDSYRRHEGLTLDQLGDKVGFRSKGQLSRLVRGERYAPIATAIAIEEKLKGAVSALQLVKPSDRQLLEGFLQRRDAPLDPTIEGPSQ